MEKNNIFTALYHVSELRSREDLIKGIIENMDYTMCVHEPKCLFFLTLLTSDGHPRIVLSKALTSSYMVSALSWGWKTSSRFG